MNMDKLNKLKKEIKKLKSKCKKYKGGNVKLIDFVSTKPIECADYLGKKEGELCSSPILIDAIMQYTKEISSNSSSNSASNSSSMPDNIKSAANALHCNSESCIISHPNFKKFVLRNHIINKNQLESELDTKFKIKGPRDNTQWLSNEDIDEFIKKDTQLIYDDYVNKYNSIIENENKND